MKNQRILITNDDGIEAQGLRTLVEAASAIGEVWVVAPDGQRSAMSHCFTYNQPIRVSEYEYGIDGVKAFACSGTPADCMKVGILKILPQRPDYAFSGINNGLNIGPDIQYSGTLGAALEAAFLGVHAIAVSQQGMESQEIVDHYLLDLLKEYMDKPLEKNTVWSINYPRCSLAECKGVLKDRKVSVDSFYAEDYAEERLENGVTAYSLICNRIWEASEGTDLAAVMNHYISVGAVHNIA